MKISAVVPDELGVTLEERPRRRPDLASYMRIEERELEAGNNDRRPTFPAVRRF
jgi:hypothetical protein